MTVDTEAMQQELQLLREENAALLEALRLAQRGGVDLRGHLSKWNPDASQQGIFTQDWELRYFVLSGSLLKYYASERDVGYEPRGVLELQDCAVEVELPVKSTGPFIFQITDPDGELLLRLSADRQEVATAWVRTLAAAGLSIHGFERFSSQAFQGLGVGSNLNLQSHKSAPHLGGSTDGQEADQQGEQGSAPQKGGGGFRDGLGLLGRAFSFRARGTAAGLASSSDSVDSTISMQRLRAPRHRAATADDTGAAAAAAQATHPRTAATGVKQVRQDRPHTITPGAALLHTPEHHQHQQGEEVHAAEAGEFHDVRHQPGVAVGRSSSSGVLLMRAASSRRWGKADVGDEVDQEQTAEDAAQEPLAPQLSSTSQAVHPRPSLAGSTLGSTNVPLSGQASSALPAGPDSGGLTGQPSLAVAAAAAEGKGRRRQQAMDGAAPVHHVVKDSVLTAQDDFAILRNEGLLNLGVVVLVATNIRLVMSNIFTYGLKVQLDPSAVAAALRGLSSPDDAVTWAAALSCTLFYGAALLIEKLGVALLQREDKLLAGLQKKDVAAAAASRQLAAAARLHEWLLFLLNVVNVAASLLLPCFMVLLNRSTLLPASSLTMVAIVTCMKLTTYAHCNTTLRRQAREQAAAAAAAGAGGGTAAAGCADTAAAIMGGAGGAGSDSPFATVARTNKANNAATAVAAGNHLGSKDGCEVVYPQNLSLGDMAYYALAPSLTYQLNYPKIKRRRPRLLARWILQLLGTMLLMSFMQVQFLLPLMQSSLLPLQQSNPLRFTERLLRLSVPNIANWLAMFYLVFHLWLNILGELLLFGDRVFYKEWWNAATLGEYWKLWNMPVHKFMLRTIFFPLVRRRWSKFPAMLLVFFVSAVMHELAVAVPLRMLRGWAFWGMLLQVPLVSLTETLRKRIKSDTLGNMIFWASFCVLGQPMCLILYYHDWVLANLGLQGLAKAAAAGAGAAAHAAATAASCTAASLVGEDVLGMAAAASK